MRRVILVASIIISSLWRVSKFKLSSITGIYKRAEYTKEASRYLISRDGYIIPSSEGITYLKSVLPKLNKEEIESLLGYLARACHELGEPSLTRLLTLPDTELQIMILSLLRSVLAQKELQDK